MEKQKGGGGVWPSSLFISSLIGSLISSILVEKKESKRRERDKIYYY